jgi:hypothetical protein
MQKTENKWKQPGLIDFLEPHGSESQGYIHYSGIYLFLARKPSCCKNGAAPLVKQTHP